MPEIRTNIDLDQRDKELCELMSIAMFRELQANRHKGPWEELSFKELFEETVYHLAKVWKAVHEGNPVRTCEAVADVSNYMLFMGCMSEGLAPSNVTARSEESDFTGEGRYTDQEKGELIQAFLDWLWDY